jgi:hypothetical protein
MDYPGSGLARLPLLILAVVAGCAAVHSAPLSYNRDVRPILSENCFACHGPDPGTREAKLRLDVREAALDREAIVPGDLEASELIYRILTDDKDELMPPPDSHKVLSTGQKEVLQEWVRQGAGYEPHWAYIRPERPPVPDAGEAHPIDNFIVARQAPEGLALSPQADPPTLARRLALDLTGLPPDPAGLGDTASGIDQLLASPHFGERMAVFWLDLARYADTIGYHSDEERDVTPYRDWVIRSFNQNKPYNRFITEQLAGDLLDEPTLETYIATTFNRVNQISEEGGIQDAEYIAKYHAERVRTTSVAFLGSTMGCAECHDHKFDPFTMRDFYAMEAFFADIFEKGAYNNNGSYNEGADIADYPVAAMGQWGPRLDLPTPEQSAELESILSDKNAVQEELDATTPELEVAFIEWAAERAADLGDGTPRDVAILDDDELDIGKTETVEEDVYSGKIARRQKGEGTIQHIVKAGGRQMRMVKGDILFAYAWLDPEDPPRQLMLQFRSGGDWDHRAWWGEDLIESGQGKEAGAHHRTGDLPAAGQWIRLEVPAAAVDLEPGDKVTELAFTQFGGTVLWDLTGRHTTDPAAAVFGLSDAARQALVDSGDHPPEGEARTALMDHYRTIAPLLAPARKRLAELRKEENAVRAMIRSTLIALPATPREIRVLPRGNWMDRSGEVVQPAVPGFLATGRVASPGERLTRLDLAGWLTSRDNPLTARAFVNRVWALFFGTGLSRDVQDLGNQGRWPTHPGLLDWLAVEFMENGWDVKHLVKVIVTSKAYRQSSNTSPELQALDPYNESYARQNARRLPAEFVRDNALAVSGLLNRQIGGRSARPYQPTGYYRELNFPKREYKPHEDENQHRRGVYMHWQRSFLHPMLIAFDAPAREECAAYRASSNTPLQALNLLNDPTFVEAARVLAQDLVAKHETFADRLAEGFSRVLNRAPSDEESALLGALHERQLDRYRTAPDGAGDLLSVGLAPVPEGLDPAEVAATTAVTRALLNLHETITRY